MAQQAGTLGGRAAPSTGTIGSSPGRLGRAFSAERLIIGSIVVLSVLLVTYPLLFLIQASLNVGRPDARPVTDYGLSNYLGILNRLEWLGNTLYVSFLG